MGRYPYFFLIISVFVGGFYGWDSGGLIGVVFGLSICFVLTMSVMRLLDTHLRRTLLKSYWIEDCGDVVKLHGSVPLIDMDRAYRDILKVRPGLIIVEQAHIKFGCTLAGIKATTEELQAKATLKKLGIPVHTIG